MVTLWYDYRNEPKTALPACYEPTRWGLPTEAAYGLRGRLGQLLQRYQTCFVTKTRDAHEQAEADLRGQLTMEAKRNFANVERRGGWWGAAGHIEDDGQAQQREHAQRSSHQAPPPSQTPYARSRTIAGAG